jgi:hypothetical protein
MLNLSPPNFEGSTQLLGARAFYPPRLAKLSVESIRVGGEGLLARGGAVLRLGEE